MELWWLLEEGGFSERYGWYLQAWDLEAEYAEERARRQQAAQRAQAREAQLRRQGWQGGPADPRDSCDFKDEGQAA